MSPSEMDDLAADLEMTTKEAAAYLSGPVGVTLSTKVLHNFKSMGRGPIVEKRGHRLVYRRSALDAFLRENGTDPMAWIEDLYRDVADQLRLISMANPDLQFGAMIEALDPGDKDDWDPDQVNS